MNAKIDKFTAARIRLFTNTGMAVQKGLPFGPPPFTGQPRMASAELQSGQRQSARVQPSRRQAS